MPEYVGTDPTYRKRGLMRVLMDALHRMSAAAGDLLQIVHGVPYFYRRFGYEYALTLWHAYGLPVYATPPLNADAEPFIVRRATFDDAAALNALALSTWPRGSVTRRRTMEEWRYELDSAIHGEHTSPVLALIDHEQQIVAACRTFAQLYEHRLYVPEVFVGTGVAYADVMPTLARVLRGHGAELARMDDGQRFDIIVFNLWEDHPALSALGAHTLIKRRSEPIYVRVPYLAPFLKYIAPALERRLAASPTVRGFSGAVTLNFYRDGLRLLWLNGKLTAVEPIAGHVGYGETYDAAFPPLVILKLLFGHRSLDELTHMYPDCRANDRAAPLLQALFPKHDVPIPF
jgi:GNAT superfamily N-acetyltransferase